MELKLKWAFSRLAALPPQTNPKTHRAEAKQKKKKRSEPAPSISVPILALVPLPRVRGWLVGVLVKNRRHRREDRSTTCQGLLVSCLFLQPLVELICNPTTEEINFQPEEDY